MEDNKLTSLLSTYQEIITNELGNSFDLINRDFNLILPRKSVHCKIFYIMNIVDTSEIEETIIKPLQKNYQSLSSSIFNDTAIIANNVLQIKNYQLIDVHAVDEFITELINGNTLVFLENQNRVISASTAKWKERNVEAPEGQRSLKGPNEGFVESLNTNVSLVRKIIKNKQLTFEKFTLGEKTNTDIAIFYLRDSVDKKVLDEVVKRIRSIKTNEIIGSNSIEEYISDNFFTPFPLFLNTDRPDVATAEILSNKIGIMVDGTPYVLIAPAPFVIFLQTPDDYYFKWNLFFGRLFRVISVILAIYIPGLYISITNFHTGLIPFKMLISLLGQSEGRPMPLLMELLLFTFFFQMIIESALRVQSSLVIGISILGTIVLGQAAVDAGIVQPASLVVISLSYILGFAIPIQTMETPIRLFRYSLIIIGALLGLYGVILVTILLVFHLTNLKSFGVPYFSPWGPFNLKDQKDSLIRSSLKKITNNPKKYHHEGDNTKK